MGGRARKQDAQPERGGGRRPSMEPELRLHCSGMELTILLIGIFLLVTLPLWAVSNRLNRIARILGRIEQMNLRSLKQWTQGEERTSRR